MKKNFDNWNIKKKHIDKNKRILEFKEGEIWWSHFGINVGEEAYGKGENFFKFTSKRLERRAMLYQVKFISANRLRIKESGMSKGDFLKMKKSLAKLLGLSWPPNGQEGQCSDHRISPDMSTCYQICNFCQV